jgi:hypothetical protein
MRFLNMRDLSHVRRTQLANHTELAKGSFATVYAESVDSATVAKITTDKYSYDLLTDGMWLQMREHVERSFTRVIEDHGDVGESRGLTAYLVEVERLHRISTTEHRRLISRWMKEYTASRHEDFVDTDLHRNTRRSLAFCQQKTHDITDPYRFVFAALFDFLRNYGGALDLKPANFMCRVDGTLVFNDVVFDVATFTRKSPCMYH